MNKRIINLDILRILAVIAVIMIHTSASFLALYDIGSIEHLWANIFDSISRFSVPVFVMISGALILDENKPITMSIMYKKYIKNIILLFLFWSSVYVIRYDIIDLLLFEQNVNLRELISDFLTGHYHMWYIYMTIGLYIITPFLRYFVKYQNRKIVLSFISLGLISQFLAPLLIELSSIFPIIENIISAINQLQLNFFGGYTVYYITGWYVVHVGISKKIRKTVTISSLIALLTTIIYIELTNNYEIAYLNTNFVIYLYATGFFIFLYNLKFKILNKSSIQSIIIKLSNLTFGVYIIHILILDLIIRLLPYQDYPSIYMIVICSLTAITCFIMCYILSKIKITKSLIKS